MNSFTEVMAAFNTELLPRLTPTYPNIKNSLSGNNLKGEKFPQLIYSITNEKKYSPSQIIKTRKTVAGVDKTQYYLPIETRLQISIVTLSTDRVTALALRETLTEIFSYESFINNLRGKAVNVQNLSDQPGLISVPKKEFIELHVPFELKISWHKEFSENSQMIKNITSPAGTPVESL